MQGRLAGPHEPGERLPLLAALQFLGGCQAGDAKRRDLLERLSVDGPNYEV